MQVSQCCAFLVQYFMQITRNFVRARAPAVVLRTLWNWKLCGPNLPASPRWPDSWMAPPLSLPIWPWLQYLCSTPQAQPQQIVSSLRMQHQGILHTTYPQYCRQNPVRIYISNKNLHVLVKSRFGSDMVQEAEGGGWMETPAVRGQSLFLNQA